MHNLHFVMVKGDSAEAYPTLMMKRMFPKTEIILARFLPIFGR